VVAEEDIGGVRVEVIAGFFAAFVFFYALGKISTLGESVGIPDTDDNSAGSMVWLLVRLVCSMALAYAVYFILV
jgi:hypothetical protein